MFSLQECYFSLQGIQITKAGFVPCLYACENDSGKSHLPNMSLTCGLQSPHLLNGVTTVTHLGCKLQDR